MPKGSNLRGKKFGGRKKGTPNKRNSEAVERARIEVENALSEVDPRSNPVQVLKKKLAKDVLEEFMMLFAGMAAAHQPLPEGMPVPPGRKPDEAKFQTYAKLTVDTAKALADFQSPKFRAIAVVAPPPEMLPTRPLLSKDNVVNINDPAAIARVYQQMVKRSA
jgi:hypothetical protein